jgi:hypothetical protein
MVKRSRHRRSKVVQYVHSLGLMGFPRARESVARNFWQMYCPDMKQIFRNMNTRPLIFTNPEVSSYTLTSLNLKVIFS